MPCVACGGELRRGATKYCSIACYRIVQRSGDDGARFWAKVDKRGAGGCWLWTSTINRTTGYGMFGGRRELRPNGKMQGVPKYAHRVAWELTHGPIPLGQWILHSCDVPHCVNPAHLFLGTQFHNMQDASEKGRLHVPRPTARKLTDEQRDAIRERYAAGSTMQALADEHGVTRPFIWQIVHRRGSSALKARTA